MPSVLITGAGRGFGRALFDAYHDRGWTVFPLVRDPGVAAGLRSDRVHPICGDVASAEVEAAIASVLTDRADSLDVLINNAGQVKKLRWLPETSAEDLEELFRVHCVGAFRCARAALPWLRRSPRGTIVNISSRFGSIARMAGGEFRGIYSYSIAKSAVNMLTAALDAELSKEGIRVFAVHPGRLTTTAGAVDAETDPRVAAEKLADWVQSVDRDAACGLWDLMENRVMPW